MDGEIIELPLNTIIIRLVLWAEASMSGQGVELLAYLHHEAAKDAAHLNHDPAYYELKKIYKLKKINDPKDFYFPDNKLESELWSNVSISETDMKIINDLSYRYFGRLQGALRVKLMNYFNVKPYDVGNAFAVCKTGPCVIKKAFEAHRAPPSREEALEHLNNDPSGAVRSTVLTNGSYKKSNKTRTESDDLAGGRQSQ